MSEDREFIPCDTLFGRRDIYSSETEITQDNIIQAVNDALSMHFKNLMEEEYLYWYRRGIQPILDRQKERNSFVLNKVTENHADEIVSFKNGYFLTQPAFYVSRNDSAQSKVDELNEYLYRSGKQAADNELVNWFHTVGKACLYVEPGEEDDIPLKAYAVDPRSAFVVYSMKPGNKPIMGINMVIVNKTMYVDAFTKDLVYRLVGSTVGKLMTNEPVYSGTVTSLIGIEPNILGHIPLIEYRYDENNKAAFESCISVLDSINTVMSNRVDGIEQFIQSIAVAVNCEFDDGVTAKTIKESGMICLRSTSDNKADFYILSEQLDQMQTQTLVDYMYRQVLKICAMPDSTKGGTSTSDTGAAVLARDGWYQADASARNTEDLFKKSNRQFDRILVDLLKRKNLLNIEQTDFELNFIRNETSNVQSKAQSLNTLLTAGLSPELAFAKSGISNDPVSDVKASDKYLKMRWGDPDKKEEEVNGQPSEMGRTEQSAIEGNNGKQTGNKQEGSRRV